MKKPSPFHFKAVLLLVLLFGSMVTVRFLPVAPWIKAFTAWMQEHGTLGIVLYVILFVVATTLFVPASLLVVAAGVAFGLVGGAALAIFSATLSAALSFLISRHLARDFVEQRLARNNHLQALDRAVSEQGWKLVILLRLVPVLPFFVTNYFFGLSSIRFWHYVPASTVGMIPATLLYVYLGYLGKIALVQKHERTPQEYAFLGVGLLMTLAVVFYVTGLAKKSLRQMQQGTSDENLNE